MSRDTDRDWSEIASAHPYYGVLTNERYLNPGAEDLKAFFDSGYQDVEITLGRCRRVFGPVEPRSALDFGCGVGRLAIPLARQCGRATGVDVADNMLALAKKHSEEFGVQLELRKTIPEDEQFDWVNSFIVLQHIPPQRGYDIIRKLWNCVAINGILTLQITIYKDNRHVGEINRDVRLFRFDGERLENYSFVDPDSPIGMSMYDYDLSRVFASLQLDDGSPVYMVKTDHGGCHGFIIHAQKL